MINELYKLSKTLSEKSIDTYKWYNDYLSLPAVTSRTPCVRIWLDEDGFVTDFESLTAEQAGFIRKFGDNQGAFPAFNMKALYRITDKSIIGSVEKIKIATKAPEIDEIASWLTEDNWGKNETKQMKRNLIARPKELLDLIGNDVSGTIIEKLANIYLTTDDACARFRDSLKKCIISKLENSIDVSLCMYLLFYKSSPEKDPSKETKSNISVVLDLQNWREYEYPIACEHTTRQINEMLIKRKQAKQNKNDEDTDAFNSPFTNPNEKMPKVKVDGNEIILRSMSKDEGSQFRYNKIGDSSYPISIENRSLAKSALEWISKPENKHIMWEKIDDEVVFVYPSRLPDVPIKFISVFGKQSSKNTVKEELRFKSISEDFIKTFQGIPVNQKPENMQIFIIRKVDRGRSKVIFTHNITPEQLISEANEWVAGCENLPKLDCEELSVPFPLEVADIVNAVWKQTGERTDNKTVKRMKYYQGIELLLNALPQGALPYYAHILNEHSHGLIYFFRNEKLREEDGKSPKKISFGQALSVGQTLSLMGLLLYKSNIRKEIYMEDFAYNFGQLLRVSDELHVLYCKVKRNGEIPTQLVGSALFVSASDMPFQAFAQLSVRINPYISWAKQYQYSGVTVKGEESWCARWLLGLYQAIADKINQKMDKSIRFGDFEKSQLFIGFMASLPKKDRSEKEQSSNEKTTGGIENDDRD